MAGDAEPFEEHRYAETFSKAALPILIMSLLLTVVLGWQLVPMPTFNTDLADFAPEDETSAVEDRFAARMGNTTRQFFVHITADDGGNLLTVASLQEQQTDYDAMLEFSAVDGDFIVRVTAVSNIVQIALTELDDGSDIADVSDWNDLLNRTVPADFDTTDATSDSQMLSHAAFIQAAILNSDLDISAVEDWIDDRNSTSDPTPSASSTLWIIEIDPHLSAEDSQQTQVRLRDWLTTTSATSSLDYKAVSLDLISNDINENTIRSLAILIVLAVLVVVAILGFAFRSLKGVLFPLSGLLAALVWTYGLLKALDVEFTALEVAVAPLVLGLGIDYSIHLQRRYEIHRGVGRTPADAWVCSLDNLLVPLSLAVITTVAAFLANVFSPLAPVREFGFALALGVVAAFFCSTIVVGSLHVVAEKATRGQFSQISTGMMGQRLQSAMRFQRRQRASIMIVTGVLTVAAVFGAMSITTEFDLTDFLDEEMDVMQVRESVKTEYDNTGLQLLFLLLEPADDAQYIDDGAQLLDSMLFLDQTLPHTAKVVRPLGDAGRPAYDGLYPVLRDAIELDSSWGEAFNLQLYNDELGVADNSEELHLGAALFNLSGNHSIANPVTGSSWSERVEGVAAIDGQGNIELLRIQILLNIGTNTENAMVVDDFERIIGEDDSGALNSQLQGVAEVHLAGDMVKIDKVLSGLTSSQVQSTAISLFVSFMVLMLLTRRFTPALVVIAPVGVAAFWVVGSMAALGLHWNVLTVMVTALTIGIGIDYSIHVWRRYEEELNTNGGNAWEAVGEMHSTTGLALLMSAGTTVCGFLVLLLSPMPVVREFGLITALTVFYSLVLSLVVLPVLLAEAGHERANGMKEGD